MPGVSGMDGVQRAVEANSGGAVVVFSGNVTQEFVAEALELGAKGYIPKTMPLKSLITSVELIASGEVFFPLAFIKNASSKAEPEKAKLTVNEIRILRFVSEGLTNKEIAWKFQLTEVTIKMHMRSICMKLKASNRTQAAIIATQAGIL
jgi:two-component system, NarL family, nitrate/nitrite response regulator NarL